ncbi:MAG: MotA/TolQ/ExbB proton channel family protein [Deltaproteobacteria bacterium]|nr:MotA/TolQ/ExbB proton channel family protein [Deltaproteobacteria bacterium]
MSITQSFKSFALLGAEWVMWILIILSLISVTIMIERAIYFFRKQPDVNEIIQKVKEKIANGKGFKDAGEYLNSIKGIAPVIAASALSDAEKGINAVEETAQSSRIREKMKLEKNLAFLGTVGNNAPFIGLFGTVIGVIQAFHDLSLNSTGGASTVMSGISEALVATAIGLLVALPAVVAYNTFSRKIKSIMGDSDALLHTILSEINSQNSKK